jgi:hypothetical protein
VLPVMLPVPPGLPPTKRLSGVGGIVVGLTMVRSYAAWCALVGPFGRTRRTRTRTEVGEQVTDGAARERLDAILRKRRLSLGRRDLVHALV